MLKMSAAKIHINSKLTGDTKYKWPLNYEQNFIHPKPCVNVSRQRIFHMNVRLRMYKNCQLFKYQCHLCKVSILSPLLTPKAVKEKKY